MSAFLIPVMRKILPLILIASAPLMGGSLPQLNEKPWVGWFAGSENRGFNFGVQMNGEGSLIPLDKRDAAGSPKKWISFVPVIEEVLPSGRVITKSTLEDGWEALSEATDEAEKISYRGTVTGGAKFEVHFEMGKGEILGGGRLLEKGELTENPIRFSLRVRIPNVYVHDKNEDALEKKAKGDKIQIERGDGKKLKFDAFEPVWAEKEDVSGPGVKLARVDLEGYDGARVELDAGDKGLFEMYNGQLRPLYKGFTFGWKPDPAKDPEGKGRFVIEFK